MFAPSSSPVHFCIRQSKLHPAYRVASQNDILAFEKSAKLMLLHLNILKELSITELYLISKDRYDWCDKYLLLVSGFNVPYKPSFNEASPIWFLGKCYDKRKLGKYRRIVTGINSNSCKKNSGS